MIRTALAFVAPWIKPAMAICAVALAAALFALWFKAEAAEERTKSDRDKLVDSERAMAILRAQTTTATAVADALREERGKDRAAARQTLQGSTMRRSTRTGRTWRSASCYWRAAPVHPPVRPHCRPAHPRSC